MFFDNAHGLMMVAKYSNVLSPARQGLICCLHLL
jgi:hypothetical protein